MTQPMAAVAAGVSLAAVAASLLLFACSDDRPTRIDDSGNLPDFALPDSPENVVENLSTAIRLRNVVEYAKLFDEDDYLFVFDSIDVVTNPNYPESCGYVGEIGWAEGCLDSPDVEEIRFEFDKGTAELLEPGDPERADESWRKIEMTEVHLEVETRNPQEPMDPLVYLVQGDRATLYLAPDPEELIEGHPVWRIMEWHDFRVGSRPDAVRERSFGDIKVLFDCCSAVGVDPF